MIRHLTGDIQRFTTTGEDLEARALLQEVGHQAGASFDEMFTIIENDQSIFVAQIIGDQRLNGRKGQLL